MHANTAKVNQIKKQLGSDCVEQCAKRFGTTGDRTRMKICYLLRNYPELTVSEIANFVGLSVSAVSHSLKKLREVDVVTSRKDAQKVFYSLAHNPFTQIIREQLNEIQAV
ncbi:MAG: metalloregulator ArsR/SmtB family transcription factor [Patescibacteria group bacterium]